MTFYCLVLRTFITTRNVRIVFYSLSELPSSSPLLSDAAVVVVVVDFGSGVGFGVTGSGRGVAKGSGSGVAQESGSRNSQRLGHEVGHWVGSCVGWGGMYVIGPVYGAGPGVGSVVDGIPGILVVTLPVVGLKVLLIGGGGLVA